MIAADAEALAMIVNNIVTFLNSLQIRTYIINKVRDQLLLALYRDFTCEKRGLILF